MLMNSVAAVSVQNDMTYNNQTTQCKLKGYNGRPRRDHGPDYLVSPMYHRQMRNTTGIAMHIAKIGISIV